MTLETRSIEIRSEISGNRITGYASVFNEPALIRGSFWEIIAPTAFDAVLNDRATDVRAFLNHDSAQLLGRQSSGTLRLATDTRGLHFEVDLPDTSAGRDARELISRGDLTGASFQFWPGQIRSGSRDGRELRTQLSVSRLVEISPVSLPAYEGTTVALRSTTTPAEDVRTQVARIRAYRKVK
ncbi:HK97 family phage prohead protease [Mycolicibacterium sp. Y3]